MLKILTSQIPSSGRRLNATELMRLRLLGISLPIKTHLYPTTHLTGYISNNIQLSI